MRLRLILAALIGAAALAGSAGGYIVGRVVTLRPGDTASFKGGWSCGYFRASEVHCIVGDQTPDVELVTPGRGPLTVKVTASDRYTRVRVVRHRLRGESGYYYESTYIFNGGAGG